MPFDYDELQNNIFSRIWRCNEMSKDSAEHYSKIVIQELRKMQTLTKEKSI